MAKFAPPEALDFSQPEKWPQWKSRFSRFRTATKLAKEDPDVQVSTLLYSLGPSADAVFERELVFAADEERNDYDKVLAAFEKYFSPVENIVHERTQFARLRQNPGESITSFSSRLHDAASKCRYDKPQEQIRDHLIAHMTNTDVSKELQKKDFSSLTLADVLKAAKSAEYLDAQMATQRPAEVAAATFSARSATRVSGGRSMSRATSDTRERECPGCGKRTSHSRRECPAWSVTCHRCKREGHYERVCRSANTSSKTSSHSKSKHNRSFKPKVEAVMEDSPNQPEPLFMGSASTEFIQDNTAPWTASLRIHGSPILFKLDSGADRTLISAQSYQTISPRPTLSPVQTRLQGPDGNTLPIQGQFEATATWKDRSVTFQVLVVDGPSNLLSRSVCHDLGLLSCSVESATHPSPPSIGRMAGAEATIELKDNAHPYNCTTARAIPAHLHDKVKAELQRMQEMGVISPVTKPTEWCAPMVAVSKPNGSVRVCVDLKRLNASVRRAHYPLPTITDTLAKLSGAQHFSTLDTASGFWQVPLSPDSAHLTTFITPFGRFQFNRLPFGITSAPEIFQQRLNAILDHIPNVVIYMDDILVFGKTQQEHDTALAAVKSTLAAAGVQLNDAKSHINQRTVKFLGHMVSPAGVRPDPAKIAAIKTMPAPTNVTELRRALGMFTFLSKFVPDMATVSAPLRALLKSDTHWTWDSAQATAFRQLQDLAESSPCLALFDTNKPIRISADASSYGLGAVLLQPEGSVWRPVAFASRSLLPAEQKYAQIEKECLAITWACEHFHYFVYGGPEFTVETDHKPLVPLINSTDPRSSKRAEMTR